MDYMRTTISGSNHEASGYCHANPGLNAYQQSLEERSAAETASIEYCHVRVLQKKLFNPHYDIFAFSLRQDNQ